MHQPATGRRANAATDARIPDAAHRLEVTPARSANLSGTARTKLDRAGLRRPATTRVLAQKLVSREYIVIENFGLASSSGLGLDSEEEACRKRLDLAASVERASAHLSVVLPALLEVQMNLVGDFRTEALA